MSRVLVTGASGFVGRNVTAAFAKDGHTIRAAVRRVPQPPFSVDIEVAQHPDFTESIDWQPLLDRIDVVIHLAGIAHTGHGVAPPV